MFLEIKHIVFNGGKKGSDITDCSSLIVVVVLRLKFLCSPQISVLTIADTVRSCSLDQCYKSFLSPATSETKRKMTTFISNIKASDSSTQHAVGFQKAFQLLRNTSNVTRQLTSKRLSTNNNNVLSNMFI